MKKIKLNLFSLLLAAVFLLGGILHFWQLGQIPVELNRDEASLGYTAYSILHTGAEEHGTTWPINVESFGDWKLPGYVYTLIPFIQLFGLKAWVIKLPSALAGIGVILLGALTTWQLSRELDNQKPKTQGSIFYLSSRQLLTLLTTLFLAIIPWHIHLSHMAYEAHLAMFFFLLGFNLFVFATNKLKNDTLKEKTSSPIYFLYPLAVFFFGLTFFTYHSYQIFTPLMAIGLIILYYSTIKKLFTPRHRPTLINSILLALFFSLTLIITSFSANQTKFSGLSIFEPQAYSRKLFQQRGFFKDRNSIPAKLQTNSATLILDQLQRNIGSLYSPRFLFFEGGTHGSHDIPGTGKLYPIQAVLILIALGSFLVFWNQQQTPSAKNKSTNSISNTHQIVLWWLITASVAPLITFEAAHTIRFSPALFPLAFLSGYGLWKLTLWANKKHLIVRSTLTAAFVLIITYSTLNFLQTYFLIAPQRDINTQEWQMATLTKLVKDRTNQYDKIIMPGTNWSPYIYFLYYWQHSPHNLSSDLDFYPVDHEGFHHVKRLGKIHFEKPNWQENEKTNQRLLYVIKKSEIPEKIFNSTQYQLEYSLTNPNAKDEWILLRYN